ncbi:dihydrolipoamide acetyltransferase family protein [Sphingorhabdus sp.]|jgi:2-oxoisovalerate dehydrogenase E2 component (dihydrolipoyl transacylase)|uniref:dihydrolipoamide acetyltransferase family protein n=1 Tax=Sphingorhabdus sp. TaxID=1902408 RepID=UPI0037C76E7F
MSIFTFNLPDIGEGIAEAEIVAWHVKVGDRISEDQPLADMMTDKATVEMESPVAGIVTKVAGEAGDVIAIGSMLVEIETATDVSQGERTVQVEAVATVEDELPHAPEPVAAEPAVVQESPTDAAAQSPSMSADHKITASPAVRQRAKDLGVELTDVKAAGGHVRHADLDAFLAYGSGQGYRAPHISARRDDEIVKVIGMRRRIADNMAASKRHIPHFTYVEEIDVTAIEAMRADLNANRGARPKLTMLPLLIVAICKSIPQFPMINARYDDENGVVTRHGAVHLGMATQTDAGLMVPVIRDAQDKNIWQLAMEIARLANAARSGTAKSEELSGSTLTVTSLGPLGGIVTTPVINRPEVAIIGPNKIVERPMFVGDTIEARKLMNLSISCDHRVVDGWDAANYVQALKKLLETPVLLFAD